MAPDGPLGRPTFNNSCIVTVFPLSLVPFGFILPYYHPFLFKYLRQRVRQSLSVLLPLSPIPVLCLPIFSVRYGLRYELVQVRVREHARSDVPSDTTRVFPAVPEPPTLQRRPVAV